MGWSAQATFFLLAAIVQAVIGAAVLIRRPRVEWAVVLAAIFLGNAALAVNSLLSAIGFGPWRTGETTYRVFFEFDRTVTLLILYLALAYPTRPKWATRPWILPTLFLVAWVSLLFPYVLHGEDWQEGLYAPLREVWTFKLASLGFVVLLVRWAYLLPRTQSPAVVGQFRLLFAAFAVRAVHVELLLFGSGVVLPRLRRSVFGELDEFTLLLRGIVSLLAVALAAFLLFSARRRVPSDRRNAIDLVLIFMGLGFVEFLVAGGQNLFAIDGAFQRYVTGAFLHVDVLVLRPILVVYAMARYDFLGSWARDRRALVVFTAILAAIGLAAGIYPGLQNAAKDPVLTWLLTIPVAVTLATMMALILNANLGTPRAEASRRYLALLEDLYRNGEPNTAALARLDRDRRHLGIEPEEAEALRRAVASRWQGDGLWLPGRRIGGRYELQRLLGSGGWGEVYLANDLVDGRAVVLKRTKALTPMERKALLAEAYLLTRLSHPNLVPLVRTEMVADEPILVLEHMPGGALATRLATTPRLAAEQMRSLAHGLFAALGAVHAAGVVHGDVKPGNLLFDDEGNVRLGDFGLARSAPPAPRLGDPTPSARSLGGTVRYLAPEQARGSPATSASDLYAAGVVLLEALTGNHPVSASAPEYEQRRKVAEDVVVVPATTGPWRALLQGLLDPNPVRRPTAARAAELVP